MQKKLKEILSSGPTKWWQTRLSFDKQQFTLHLVKITTIWHNFLLQKWITLLIHHLCEHQKVISFYRTYQQYIRVILCFFILHKKTFCVYSYIYFAFMIQFKCRNIGAIHWKLKKNSTYDWAKQRDSACYACLFLLKGGLDQP